VGAEDIAEQLVHSYGSEWESVWRLCDDRPELRARVVGGLPEIKAELVWAARAEMAVTLADLLVRRTPLAFQLRDNARGIAREVAELVAPELGWDAAAIDAAVAEWELEATRLFSVAPMPVNGSR
jgi:glycerol-3-phosphate dehydrogenase